MATQRIAIVGAGFSGAVLARELLQSDKFEFDIFDQRDHVAGNCHTSRDAATGIMLHHYGPHIFNTSREDVWAYVNRFSKFRAFTNRVKAVTSRGVFSLPVNLHTINQFFDKKMNPREAEEFVLALGDKRISEPRNFEEQALKMLGRELYENFFYGYSKKQWGVEPRELPASVLKRLPVRFNYDDNYYNQSYQGIPEEGYTAIVEKLLDHPKIHLHLKTAFEVSDRKNFAHVFWSGPIDQFFGYELGRLNYRSLEFKKFEAAGDFQGNPVINYCEEKIPFTRIHEHKHFAAWEKHDKSLYFQEFSRACGPTDVPYYPMRLSMDVERLQSYVARADKESSLSFMGRLGTYRYLDMHQVIGESLDLAKNCLSSSTENWPRFSVRPI